ncbi:MAG TPA: ROK family protein [Aggregatilinea sp.]|uniref:ROK family protein n=1 Tax=Aggregatilinea sp. TaxID=2806333 RepID=UPI002D192630|nr:ROK family protein [Aggregatilinea sp.]HML23485.1 ROK family protein [Aggregatilinea sp.]
MCEFVIGVDLGGTQMRAARLDCALNVLERVAEPTLAPRGPEDVIERLIGVIKQVLPEDLSQVDGIGVSAPGPIDPRAGMIYSPPNLPGWNRVPLRKIIQERLGITTYLGNDANVAALAEATAGAAVGYKHVVYLTFSTGIGSGIIDDGHLIIGSRGLGAEAGHMILNVDGRISTLEKEAAGPAIARKAVARLEAGAASSIRDRVEGDLSRVTAKLVGEAASAGDALAIELMQQAGFTLGLGIVSLLHLFNPEIVVVGGGVSLMGEMVFAPMREAVKQYVIDPAYYENVPIVPAALGENVALIGAAALVTTRGGSNL